MMGKPSLQAETVPGTFALDYHSMTGKRSVEQQLAALDELRHQAPEACIEPLRKVLAYRNNYVVAKAADLVREFRLSGLMPELLAAFDRFFANPIKTDPQCWAKNALSRALAALECQDSAVFLRGLDPCRCRRFAAGRGARLSRV